MKEVKFKIRNAVERDAMILAFANNGYKAIVKEEESEFIGGKSFYRSVDYYIVVETDAVKERQ